MKKAEKCLKFHPFRLLSAAARVRLWREGAKQEDKYQGKLMNVLKTSAKELLTSSHCTEHIEFEIIEIQVPFSTMADSRRLRTLNHFQFSERREDVSITTPKYVKELCEPTFPLE